MKDSCDQEGVRGNQIVPQVGNAEALHRRRRERGSWEKQGFPHATEPQAKEVA